MYHPYWVHGSKGYLVHIAHIPALLWNKNRVHCLFWDTVIPTNEGIPAADYHFVAACTLYCMYKPYWVCGSKANWYTQLLYPCCRMKNHVYGQVWGALVATIEGIPVTDYDFMVVWTVYCMYQPYWVGGSKGYLVHITHIPALLWNKNRVHCLFWDAVIPTNEGIPAADYHFVAACTLYCMYKPYWVCGSKANWYTQLLYPCCRMKNHVYGQVWGALVATIEGIPVTDYDFMVVWTVYCMYQPYWVGGSKGYLVHIAHIPALLWNKNRVHCLFWDAVIPTNEGIPAADYHFVAACTLYCMYKPYWVCGSKANWYTQLLYPCCRMKNHVYGQVWGALVATIEGIPVTDYDFMVVWTVYCMYQPYWVGGSKGYLVHIAHIPALLWNKNRVHCIFWDAVIPTNEGIPAADYHFVAACTLYCMYKPYWVCGSKGYLVHTTRIPPAIEWKIAYMAKFEVPSFPQSRASVWQIMIFWQFGPQTVCNSNIGSVGPKGDLVHIAHIPALLWNQNGVYGIVWDAVLATNDDVPVADYDFVAVWTLYCMYKPYWFCESKGYLVHKAHLPPAIESKVAYMAKFVVPSVPQTRASLWQIMILWQSGPCTVCTSHIGSVGSKVIWYPQLLYPLLWNEKSH